MTDQDKKPLPETILSSRKHNYFRRKIVGLIVALLGLLVFILGAEPAWFGADRSSVTGFVQITVFLMGLGLICLGGFIGLRALWMGDPLTLLADIGMRVLATGYVVSVVSGLADVFGFGSEPFPNIPTFGRWQLYGVIVGEAVILLGLLLIIPWNWLRLSEEVTDGKD